MMDAARRVVVLGLGAALAGGCGFEPLYGTDAGAVPSGLAIQVSPVDAAPIDGRVGQILRNELLRLFDPGGDAGQPVYRLDIALTSSSAALAISSDGTITRYNVILDASVRLVGIADEAEVYRTTARSVGSYDLQQSDFGSLVAERATQEDAARDLGRRIATMIATVLAQRGA
jgi:LPS-assembly lipoprotein